MPLLLAFRSERKIEELREVREGCFERNADRWRGRYGSAKGEELGSFDPAGSDMVSFFFVDGTHAGPLTRDPSPPEDAYDSSPVSQGSGRHGETTQDGLPDSEDGLGGDMSPVGDTFW